MKRFAQTWIALSAVAAVASLSSAVNAGITSLEATVPDTAESGETCLPVDSSMGNGLGGSVTAWGTQEILSAFDITGAVDSDPTLYLIETIKNTTASTWNGYTITITPDSPLVVSGVVVLPALNPTFQKFGPSGPVETDFAVGSGWEIDYSGGTVAPGQTVQFVIQFDITETSGNFGYHIGNIPASGNVPEPASLGLLAAGALGFLVRRRR